MRRSEPFRMMHLVTSSYKTVQGQTHEVDSHDALSRCRLQLANANAYDQSDLEISIVVLPTYMFETGLRGIAVERVRAQVGARALTA